MTGDSWMGHRIHEWFWNLDLLKVDYNSCVVSCLVPRRYMRQFTLRMNISVRKFPWLKQCKSSTYCDGSYVNPWLVEALVFTAGPWYRLRWQTTGRSSLGLANAAWESWDVHELDIIFRINRIQTVENLYFQPNPCSAILFERMWHMFPILTNTWSTITTIS